MNVTLNKKKGFNLVELIIAISIFTVISLSAYKAFVEIIKHSLELSIKSEALALANEQFEVLRNLPYTQVGIIGSIPPGIVPHISSQTRSGRAYQVTTTIRNFDDPYDGIIGGSPNDLSPADSKIVEVEVVCTNCQNIPPVVFSGRISPRALETASNNGALFVKVFDANGQTIQGADVDIIDEVSGGLNIEDVTNNLGMLQIVDIPPKNQAYKISVTKPGFSSESTFATSTLNPNPTKPNATVANQLVTQVSLSIDRLGSIALSSKDLSCNAVSNTQFNIKGSKLIGTGPNLYKVNQDLSTNVSGLYTINNTEWDTYDISLLGSTYSLAGSSPELPLSHAPGANDDLVLYTTPQSSQNLLVVVKDGSSGIHLSGAEVKLEKAGFSKTLITNEGFYKQTDWSGGSGQDNWTDEKKFLSSTGNIDTNNPSGEIKLQEIFPGTYPSSGNLTSSTFDVGTSSTLGYVKFEPNGQNPLLGTDPVKFQLASSETNTATTTWNFVGPDGTSGSFYTSTNQKIASSQEGDRYFRYKIFLSTSDTSRTPNVSDVFITFASACTPPGQVYFGSLSNDTYTLTVSKSGYTTYANTVDVNSGGQKETVILNP